MSHRLVAFQSQRSRHEFRHGGYLMTTSGEHEPGVIGWANYDELREAVAIARRERRQRGETYLARHRRATVDGTDGQDTAQRSA